MGQLIRQIKKKNGLIRRFAEEEDAVGVVEIDHAAANESLGRAALL